MRHIGPMTGTSANSIELSVLLTDLVNVNIVIARSKCKVAAIGRKFDALNDVRAIGVHGNQLASWCVKDHPSAHCRRAENEHIAIRGKAGGLCPFAEVFRPHDQMGHGIPQVDRLVVASGDELILRWMNGQCVHFFGVAL